MSARGASTKTTALAGKLPRSVSALSGAKSLSACDPFRSILSFRDVCQNGANSLPTSLFSTRATRDGMVYFPTGIYRPAKEQEVRRYPLVDNAFAIALKTLLARMAVDLVVSCQNYLLLPTPKGGDKNGRD